MIHQNVITFLHHGAKRFVLRKLVSDLLSQHIVRLHQIHHLAVLPDQTVAVACAHIKVKNVCLQLLLHRLQEHCTFLGTDLTRTVVDDRAVLVIVLLLGKRDDVAAQSHIRVFHWNTNRECLKRRTPRIKFSRVVSQHGEIGSVAARLHAVRDRMYHADLTFRCQFIHLRCLCIL